MVTLVLEKYGIASIKTCKGMRGPARLPVQCKPLYMRVLLSCVCSWVRNSVGQRLRTPRLYKPKACCRVWDWKNTKRTSKRGC